jgi:hypothetical protein
MEWYHYIAVFFAGAFLCNAVPHFVSGVMGNKFPTPFAKPPGKGLSSPMVNVLWGGFNLLIGHILLMVVHMHRVNHHAMILFFAGFMLMAVMIANNFSKKDKE